MGSEVLHKPVTWQKAKESGPALFSWRRSVGLNRVTFARIANVSERTMATYEKHPKFPDTVRCQITEAVRLVKALLEIIPANELSTWMQTTNPGFQNRKPWTLIQQGERDVIWEMIYQTRVGSFA